MEARADFDADALVGAIFAWPKIARLWWRSLLETAPAEALLLAELALLLDARPVDPLSSERIVEERTPALFELIPPPRIFGQKAPAEWRALGRKLGVEDAA